MSLLTLAAFAAFSASAKGDDAPSERALSPVVIYLDGKEAFSGRATIINSTTYVAFRDFSANYGAKVTWNALTRTAHASHGTRSISAKESTYYVQCDGRYFYTVEPIRIINDTLYVPIRAISRAFGVDVTWDNAKRAVRLTSTGKMPVSADEFYKSADLYWLSRIISAEAKGEVFRGQMAVGNVVINRVASPLYPSTIYGVIFDRKGGTQFSPVAYGTIYQTPTESSVIAAKVCLEGYSISNDILFFMNPRIATNNWISKNRPFAFTIGNHDFYK